ncbi:MAG: DNA/RNA non-specific endonuclease [Candidatus Vecturithrix sp.]|nr:DNA/RNA non-specific endonuclease [Candidatus Vecturithrix sp.]
MKARSAYLVVALFAFIVGVAFEYWFITSVWPYRHQTYTWVYALRNHRKPGEPCKTDLVLDRQGFSLGYSYIHKSALWVSYIISEGSVNLNLGSRGNFSVDHDIPPKYRVQPEEHVNTGYDKGHLAPSATIDFSFKANRETYLLSNVVFQDPKLNRQAWSKVEDLERKWAKTKGKLYVVTGPLYPPQPEKINDIPVPSKFYKVIYAYKADKAIGFLFPNKAVETAQVWDYAMSVAELEKESGLSFFSNFRAKKQNQLKQTVDFDWWKAGEEEDGVFCKFFLMVC